MGGKAVCENAKKNKSGVGRGWGQDGCERRIEVIVKMPKTSRGSGVGEGGVRLGVRVVVNEKNRCYCENAKSWWGRLGG